MGPSWYLMPDVYENFFAEFGKKPEDFFALERLDPSYRIFFGGEKTVDIVADLEKNYELFEGFEEGGGQKLKEYLKSSKEMYDFSIEEMLYRDYTSILDFLSGKLIFKGYKLKIWENLQHYVNNKFQSDEARKILQYSIGFLGGSPQNTPSFYHIMSHIDLEMGVWYPQGGMAPAHKATGSFVIKTGHGVPINDATKALRKSVGLDELPPTTHEFPEALEEVQKITKLTGFDSLIGYNWETGELE